MRVLKQWTREYAKRNSLAPQRVERLIVFTAIGQVLRGEEKGIGEQFVIKGGVAMELRMGEKAHTTKDIDIMLLRDTDGWLDYLDKAFRRKFEEITLERKRLPEKIGRSNASRVEVKVFYKGNRWLTIPVEISPPEAVDLLEPEYISASLDLQVFGLPFAEPLMLVGLPH